MVRELSRFGAIKMTKDPDSYVIIDKSDKKGEINEVSYYYASKMRLAMTERIMIDGDMIVRLFFYLTAICLIVLGFYPIYVFLVMLTVFLTDVILLNICAICLKQKNYS